MTSKIIFEKLQNFNIETLAFHELQLYKKHREKYSKRQALLAIIELNKYSSRDLTELAEFINEYEITIK